MAVHYNNKVCGQSGSIVPRFPGSGILVPCGHGQIFMAAQVWHGMLQTLVPGYSFEQLAWQEQLEPGSSGCWCCRCSGCGLHTWHRWGQCRLCCLEAVSCWSLQCGIHTTWGSVDCFDLYS